ncbi:MAG: HAMP domain-containing protein [Rhodospirillaceae bacterium]|nr:HAMP domain-containing protein [Rhodospirillaceae bacterium]
MNAETSPSDTIIDGDTHDGDTAQVSQGAENSTAKRFSSMSVGIKVYGIVALCLTLLAAVGGAGIWQMGKIGTELESIAEQDIPLTSGLTKVTIHQLEQAVNFERAFRFGEEMVKHPEIRKKFEKTVHHFEKLSHKVEKELKEVEAQAETAAHNAHSAADKKEFVHVVAALKKIEGEHKGYETIAVKALKLIDGGQVEEAIRLEDQIVALEDKLDHELEALLTEVGKFTEKAAKTAEAHEQFAIKLLIGLALAAFALGAFASFLLVRSAIIRPLTDVVGAVDSMTKGDLEVEVKIHSDDEIGAVAKALGVFKESMIEAKRLEAQQREAEKKALEEERQREAEKMEAERKEAEQKAAEKGAVTAVSSALSPQASTSHD